METVTRVLFFCPGSLGVTSYTRFQAVFGKRFGFCQRAILATVVCR